MKALVTGASTGIGKALAIELAKKGYEVGLVARSKEKLEKVKEEVLLNGGKAEIFVTDLSDPKSVSALIEEVRNKFETLDLLANIAAVWHDGNKHYFGMSLGEYSEEQILDIMSVGVTAPMMLARGFAPIMPKGSNIVNISGTFWVGGMNCVPIYVSKRAIEDLTMALAVEYKVAGIAVNCVSPSDTGTESLAKYFPEELEEGNTVEDVVETIVKLMTDGKTGRVVVVQNKKVIEEGFHK